MKISYKNLKRYKEIGHILIKYGFSIVVEKLNVEGIAYKIPITNPPEHIKYMTVGERIKRATEELGPTYVKLGQILSTRKDIIDQDIIDELVKLRDSVEAFDTEEALKIFKNETGSQIEDIFSYFNKVPIAAASIGQVYEATLKNGDDVIIKIQRPNIEETIKSDLEILEAIMSSLTDLRKDIEINISEMIDDLKNQLLRELDYNFEAISAVKFAKMFKDDKEVHIPKVYLEYSSKRVLVMEKVVGTQLSQIDKIHKLKYNTKTISEIGVRALFKQIFEYGFFHADPHPGNIFVIKENCISYIDFGMVGIIDDKTLKLLNEIVLAAIEKNVDRVVNLLIEIDAITSEVDTYGLKQDLLYLIHYYADVPIEKMSISAILNEVFRFFRKYKVSIPSQLVILAKTVITLEGTARELNPNFSIASITTEFIRSYYKNMVNPKRVAMSSKHHLEEVLLDLRTIPKQLRIILKNLEKNKVKINIDDINLTNLEKSISDLATQLSLSLVLAALVVGSSLIISSPNIGEDKWIKFIAITGFSISFIIGLFLVIKILRNQYRKK